MLDELAEAVQGLGPDSSDRDFFRVSLLRVETGRWLVEHAAHGRRYTPEHDHFEGTSGLPEVRRSELDVDRLASGLLFHGAIVVRGFMTADEVAVLREHLHSQLRSAEEFTADGPPDPALVEELRQLGFPKLSPRAQADLIAIYRRDGFADMLQTYLGEPPVAGIGRMTLELAQESGGGLPWHQDGAYFLGECGAVASWCALTPIGDACPGLDIVPRRFTDVIGRDALNELEERPDLQYSHAFEDTLLQDTLAETPPVVPVLAPGDTVLFDEMTLHQTDRRHFDAPAREKAITWFFAPSRFAPAVNTPTAI